MSPKNMCFSLFNNTYLMLRIAIMNFGERQWELLLLLDREIADRENHIDMKWCMNFFDESLNSYIHLHFLQKNLSWHELSSAKLCWTYVCCCLHDVRIRYQDAPSGFVYNERQYLVKVFSNQWILSSVVFFFIYYNTT